VLPAQRITRRKMRHFGKLTCKNQWITPPHSAAAGKVRNAGRHSRQHPPPARGSQYPQTPRFDQPATLCKQPHPRPPKRLRPVNDLLVDRAPDPAHLDREHRLGNRDARSNEPGFGSTSAAQPLVDLRRRLHDHHGCKRQRRPQT